MLLINIFKSAALSVILLFVLSCSGPPESSGENPASSIFPGLERQTNVEGEDHVPSPDQLLDDVVTGLPLDSLIITGSLVVRKQRGVVIGDYLFEMLVEWGGRPPWARYVIKDDDGRILEQLKVIHSSGSVSDIEYSRGEPSRSAQLTNLTQLIQNTDISWMDLTLSFLWWRGGKITGEEEIKGFDCYIVDVPRPSGVECEYAYVRLWIEKKIRVLLQAEGYDSEGDIIRRLWIKSCKKIDDRWMIKDMEIQGNPAEHRTKLRVKAVEVSEQ